MAISIGLSSIVPLAKVFLILRKGKRLWFRRCTLILCWEYLNIQIGPGQIFIRCLRNMADGCILMILFIVNLNLNIWVQLYKLWQLKQYKKSLIGRGRMIIILLRFCFFLTRIIVCVKVICMITVHWIKPFEGIRSACIFLPWALSMLVKVYADSNWLQRPHLLWRWLKHNRTRGLLKFESSYLL